jgi:hypothetical protein
MKRSFTYCVTIVLTLAAASVLLATTVHAGCDFSGTWISFMSIEGFGDIPTWMSTGTGQSASSGVMDLEIPDLDVTGNGNFPAAVMLSHYKGVWERTSGNTTAYTMVAYAVDATGGPVYISKIRGTATYTENCNTATVTTFEDIFVVGDPSCDNPFEDEPCYDEDGNQMKDIDLGVSVAHRVTVE